jgi:hypothetical protein
MEKDQNTVTAGGRLILVTLILVFSLPFAGAWLIYHYTDMGRDAAGNSYGELIEPPLPLPDLELLDPDNGANKHRLHGKWSLVYVSSGVCDTDCVRSLETAQGIRLALGNDAARMQTVLMYAGSPGEPVASLDRLPVYLMRNDSPAARIIGQLLSAEARPSRPETRWYLIDPLGNLMMRYPADREDDGIIRDLKRLLRYSRIG